MMENSVGVLSSIPHIGKPDYYFHPSQYTRWCAEDNLTPRRPAFGPVMASSCRRRPETRRSARQTTASILPRLVTTVRTSALRLLAVSFARCMPRTTGRLPQTKVDWRDGLFATGCEEGGRRYKEAAE